MEIDYKLLNYEDLNHQFHLACIRGDLNLVKYLLTSSEIENHADIHFENDESISLAARYGNLEVLKYLLTSPDLKIHADPHSQNDGAFRWACTNGHLNIIEYFLFDPSINRKFSLQKYSHQALIRGIYHDKINLVEYILHEPELIKYDITHDKGRILEAACECGRLEILKYLLNLPQFNTGLDFNFNNDSCFKGACEYGHLDIVEFLIFEQNLQKTEEIKKYIESSKKDNTVDLDSFFNIRDLKKSLQSELTTNQLLNKKVKV